MSKETKLRGGGNSELTKLKLVWRDSLSESAREYWRALFISDATQAQVRQEIAAKLKIKLSYDKQLTQFRAWLEGQDAMDAEEERMAEDERRLKEQFGDTLSLDQIREKVLKASYARTMAAGDFKLGLNTAKVDLKNKEVSLEREKFEELKRKAAQADAAKGILENKEITEADRKTRMHELFGIS